MVTVSSTMAHTLDKGMCLCILCVQCVCTCLCLLWCLSERNVELVRMVRIYQPICTLIHTHWEQSLSTILAKQIMIKPHWARGICTATLPSCTFSNRKIFILSIFFLYLCLPRSRCGSWPGHQILLESAIQILTFNKQSSEAAVYSYWSFLSHTHPALYNMCNTLHQSFSGSFI